MSPRISLLAAALLALGCRENLPETGRAPAAGDPAASADTVPPQAREGEVEYEAPRLIPGVRAQLDALSGPESNRSPENLTAYKNAVGRLVNAMQVDLNHVGISDTGEFRELRDSVLLEIGGGTGLAKLSPEDFARSSARLQRLIGLYESRMRASQSAP